MTSVDSSALQYNLDRDQLSFRNYPPRIFQTSVVKNESYRNNQYRENFTYLSDRNIFDEEGLTGSDSEQLNERWLAKLSAHRLQ